MIMHAIQMYHRIYMLLKPADTRIAIEFSGLGREMCRWHQTTLERVDRTNMKLEYKCNMRYWIFALNPTLQSVT